MTLLQAGNLRTFTSMDTSQQSLPMPAEQETIERLIPTPGKGVNRFERVPVLIFDDPDEMSRQIARRIANLIQEKQATGEHAVLGLPTGSTPIGVYRELVRMHREEGLDFSNVITFNLDEYYPMDPNSLQSYHRFMWEHLFAHVNIPPENVHIPDGTIPREEIERYCLEYEHQIEKAGGLDLTLLGIGRSGHIGFNEPGSGPETRTRLVVLDEITRKDAASDFFGEENVPREAITMGVGTILESREIILMATGEHKAPIVRRAVEEPPNREVVATYLQLHPHAYFYLDRAAASELTREKTPWMVREVDWDLPMAKKAVIWLARKLNKAILKLEAADFHRNHLHELVHTFGDVDRLCFLIFEDLRKRITYAHDLPKKQRIIVFSPHPDDDVISMGGMLDKLAQNENDITVAYMTSGSIAVFDQDVLRYLRFLQMSGKVLGLDALDELQEHMEKIEEFLSRKKPGEPDIQEVQELKAHIRYAEAISAIEVLGLSEANARFLDLPFYRTGMVKKKPIGEEDVAIILHLMEEKKPDHLFVAGDLSDPHGTHRLCYAAIRQAYERYVEKHGEEPTIWLYRGAWQEWEVDRTDVFLPMSKADLDRKIDAIFKHESQKDRALFPGAYDEREFWQRARDRNMGTARELDQLGLPEFYAAEAYVIPEKL